jgi:TonB-linked SusC/RagA family outer membrane protein
MFRVEICSINAIKTYMKRNKILVFAVLASVCLPTAAQQNKDSLSVGRYEDQSIDVGANKTFKISESTAAVSVIGSNSTDKRSARNIGNSIIGQGLGLISLQNSGNYAAANPTFYVRGLQSLSGSTPLILVDGIERDINNITPEEVDNVQILKDAAAVALYGYKGANGAILVTTKRGKYNSKSITVTLDHVFNFMANKPKFVDASTYAQAMNEAYANEGYGNNYRYSDNEIAAFKSGQYPYYYPNVNWMDETFKNTGATNKMNAQFSGGGQMFRYYAMIDLISDKGFIKNPNENDGYSTQNKYVKGNMRANLDIDLTPTIKVKANVLGVLLETSRPGSNVDLWNMIYSTPSAAYPIKAESGSWGGSDTWAGTSNPVAQSIGAAYYKNHTRSLYSDLTLRQDLSGWIQGLSAQACVGYDNTSNIYEDHSKTYIYDVTTPTWTADMTEPTATVKSYGTDSSMGSGADINSFSRRFHFDVSADYQNRFGNHSIYSQLKWDYEFQDETGYNTTIYRQNYSWFNHYGYKDRYFADLTLVYSGSSRLAPGTKWNLSPTVAAAWVISKENFMQNVNWINFLKLRASFGMLNQDLLPSNTWTYYVQQYSISGGTYPFNSGWGSDFGRTYLDRLATTSPSHEKAYKYDAGIDATLFNGLNVTLDGYFQRRTNIWVEASGKYTALIGVDSPYENAGIVNCWGGELGLDYSKQFGDLTFNLGGNFNYNRNKIKEELEEPRLYDNLVQTNHQLSQIYGLQAIGFFKDQADIDASPTQTFSTVKPGDIKYKDVNGDNIIDANDKTAIGYSTAAPQIYYSIHLGAEWKGFGIDAMFQGTGKYSAVLNTKSMYWPLINNTTISQYYYDNRWTTETASTAKFPRLSPESNANNYQTNTVWLANRSFFKLRNIELYYNFAKSVLERTKFINGAKIYVRGTDLFSIDHLSVSDPESYGATNPLTRSIVAGLSVTF